MLWDDSQPALGTVRTGPPLTPLVDDSTRSRLAIGAMALGGFGIGTTEFAAMGLLPDIAADLHIDTPAAGQLISAYALGVVVGAPLIATVFARVPRRTLLIGLMVAFTVGNGLSALAPGHYTLLAARFLAGLPHGAFFGVAALVAAELAGPDGRGRAVGQVLMGLSVANVVGVPLVTLLGDAAGWRWAMAVVVAIGAATVAALFVFLPPVRFAAGNPITELGALRRPQVWFALLTGVVGFGGMFAVYTYLSTALTTATGIDRSLVPVVLAIYGVGMVLGNHLGGRAAGGGRRARAADRRPVGTGLHDRLPGARGDPGVHPRDHRIGAGTRLADPVDGCGRRRADPGGDAQSLGAEHGQCTRRVPRWRRDRSGLRLRRAGVGGGRIGRRRPAGVRGGADVGAQVTRGADDDAGAREGSDPLRRAQHR
jgi:MFS family permease